MTAEQHAFEAEVSQVLRLVINSLYSNNDIFLRELVSNASDALDKIRFLALTKPELQGEAPLSIHIKADPESGCLSISDNGIGMNKEELMANLGTVAHSGSRAFFEAIEASKKGDLSLIGQFGVGFYSAFLVADKVEVLTKRAGEEGALRWVSEGVDSYTIEAAEREGHGSELILHLRDDAKEYLETWKLRSLIERYSDYIAHPIMLWQSHWEPGEKEGDEPKESFKWEQVNRAKALWQRPAKEVKEEEYQDFYKHLTHDFEAPLAYSHFKVEGTQLFTGLLFLPEKPAFDLYAIDQYKGIRLYVKRVFIMDDVRELLPTFLRFLRGLVDSDDLPLNVSREILQDSKMVQFIKKQVAKKALDMLLALAKDRPSDYEKFWETYGAVIKEGFHTSREYKDQLTQLVRFKSTQSEGGWTTLQDYKDRMSEDQKHIYYIIAESAHAAETSPHIEGLRAKGYEVLFLTDPIDEWAIEGLGSFDEHELRSAMKADLDIEAVKTDGEDKLSDDEKAEAKALLLRFKEVLGDRVGDVRESSRLTTSPVCLVVPEHGMHAHMERLMKASQPGFMGTKKILEVNTSHPILLAISKIAAKEPSHQELGSWIEVLYAQALLSEGSHLDDPAGFVNEVSRLLEGATEEVASQL